ncbi:MAG TPA: DsbA family oxidoreductase [Asticcacaulis sp.]|nr:DsbA family oxidoreductase [Asticcacaulis sp.]
MKIEIWSDVICPFCYIGKAQLEAALAELDVDTDIEHRAFRLSPGEPVAPVEAVLARKYGMAPAQVQASQRNVEAMAAQAGLEFHLGGTFSGDTTDAHKLLLLAADKGMQAALLNRLYHAYFTEQRNIFDHDILLGYAEEVGLNRTEAAAALDSAELAARVAADQRTAENFGVRGVPFVVIDRKIGVSGAQGTPAFLQALEAAIADAPKPVIDGDTCGVDGTC